MTGETNLRIWVHSTSILLPTTLSRNQNWPSDVTSITEAGETTSLWIRCSSDLKLMNSLSKKDCISGWMASIDGGEIMPKRCSSSNNWQHKQRQDSWQTLIQCGGRAKKENDWVTWLCSIDENLNHRRFCTRLNFEGRTLWRSILMMIPCFRSVFLLKQYDNTWNREERIHFGEFIQPYTNCQSTHLSDSEDWSPPEADNAVHNVGIEPLNECNKQSILKLGGKWCWSW